MRSTLIALLGVIAAFVAGNLILLWLLRELTAPRHGFPELPFLLFYSLYTAQAMLIGVWLGASELSWKSIAAVVIYAAAESTAFLTMLYFHNPYAWRLAEITSFAYSAPLFIGIVLEVLVYSLALRMICKRRTRLKQLSHSDEISELFMPSFSLKELSAVITLAAILLAVGNEPSGLLTKLLQWRWFNIAAGRMTESATRVPCILVVCWSLFGLRIRWWGLLLACYLCATATLAQQWYLVPKTYFFEKILTDLIALTVALVVLTLYRGLGIRWTAVNEQSQLTDIETDSATLSGNCS